MQENVHTNFDLFIFLNMFNFALKTFLLLQYFKYSFYK